MANRHNNRHQPPPTLGRASMGDFAYRVASGQLTARDRLNQPIRPGQQVLFHANLDVVMQVLQVSPVLDPRAPQGIVEITVSATFKVQAMVGQPTPQVVIIAQPEQIGDGTGDGDGTGTGDGAGDGVEPPAPDGGMPESPREGADDRPPHAPADAPTDHDAVPTAEAPSEGAPDGATAPPSAGPRRIDSTH